jgi:hypothetical protein
MTQEAFLERATGASQLGGGVGPRAPAWGLIPSSVPI